MKRITGVIVVAVVAAVSAFGGYTYGIYATQRSCLNDPSFTDIGGVKFACIDKNQFISRYLTQRHSDT
jgi:hypothetical protein